MDYCQQDKPALIKKMLTDYEDVLHDDVVFALQYKLWTFAQP